MGADFRIYSICVVKNEGDIIGACLEAAKEWSDRIFVYDGESDDNTWEVVNQLADDKIVPWKQNGKTFQESLRAEVFDAFRGEARPGDWWCHLDADEFYVQNPRRLLTGVPWPYHVVWGVAIEYYLTDEDMRAGRTEPTDNVGQRLESLKYYQVTNSEPRFFRHRERLTWPLDASWPRHIGPVYPERILYKHYKYRSALQIQTRLDTRRKSVAEGFPGWEHARSDHWQEKIMPAANCLKYDGRGYSVDENRIPDHLGSLPKRLAKLALHGVGVYP